MPECESVAPVSRLSVIGCSPRRPVDCAGRARDTQTVSETTTASVAAAGPMARSVSAKWGEPTSSSSSQSTLMFTGTPASSAARAPNSADSAGPLSSVVPRPRYVSPCRVNVKGSVLQGSVSLEAGTTSRWL